MIFSFSANLFVNSFQKFLIALKKRKNPKRPAPSPLTLNRLVDGFSARKTNAYFLSILPGSAHPRRTLMIV
jgi:hypothetical protein